MAAYLSAFIVFASALFSPPVLTAEPGPQAAAVRSTGSLVLIGKSISEAEAAAVEFEQFKMRAVALLAEPKDIVAREAIQRIKDDRQSFFRTCLSTTVFVEALGAGRLRALRFEEALCAAVAGKDPRACGPADAPTPEVSGSGFSEDLCRQGYQDARLSWGLLTKSPEFGKICEESLSSYAVPSGKRAKACRALAKKGDGQAACDRLKRILWKEPVAPPSDEAPRFGPDNCAPIVNAWKAELSACESLTHPVPEGFRASCLIFQAFRRALQGRDPKLCGEDAVCGAMMGRDAAACDFVSRVNESGCKRLLERMEVDERDREKRLLADPTNPEADMARSFGILFPDIQTTLLQAEGAPPAEGEDEAVGRLKEMASSRTGAPNREGLVLAVARVRISNVKRIITLAEAGLDAYQPQFETQAARGRVGAVRKKIEALAKELVTSATVGPR